MIFKKYLKITALCFTFILCIFLTSCSSESSEKKFSSADKSSENTLTILNSGKYINPEILKYYEKETGITIKYEEYASPEEMYTKYKSGSIKYDLICTSDYMIEKLLKEKELQKIDKSKIENYKNISQNVLALSTSFDKKNEYTVPYFYGTVGLLYNKKFVTKDEASSWNVLWNKKYKNEIIQQNSVRDAFIPALSRLNYSINTTNKNELKKALLSLKEQYPLVYAYMVDETGDEMIAENAYLAVVYSGEAAYAMEYNKNLNYVIPKEGSNVWIDSWFIPKTCQNKIKAQDFLNFLCDNKIAKKNFDYVRYSSPIKSVKDNLSKEDKNDPTISPKEADLKNCELFHFLSNKDQSYMNKLWQELKSIY